MYTTYQLQSHVRKHVMTLYSHCTFKQSATNACKNPLLKGQCGLWPNCNIIQSLLHFQHKSKPNPQFNLLTTVAFEFIQLQMHAENLDKYTFPDNTRWSGTYLPEIAAQQDRNLEPTQLVDDLDAYMTAIFVIAFFFPNSVKHTKIHKKHNTKYTKKYTAKYATESLNWLKAGVIIV